MIKTTSWILYSGIGWTMLWARTTTAFLRPHHQRGWHNVMPKLSSPSLFPPPLTQRRVWTTRDADDFEQLIGGERYAIAELPDSMLDTTLFVGNLCEFVHDDDLSKLFQSVSTLHSVPACVARKPDMSSLQYGFVAFPNVNEKEAAIIRFHNYSWKGRTLKVEPIRDDPSVGRVKIPERMVHYVVGSKPVPRNNRHKNSYNNGKSNSFGSVKRISRDDVERLSRGQPAKRKGSGNRNVPHRLNDEERAEFARAAKKGFVSLSGGGNRRTRKGSPLANIHRQWCDARSKPQILLYKATQGRQPLDRVVVDFSPLRLYGLFDAAVEVDDYMVKWKVQTLTAANNAGMELCAKLADYHDDDDDDSLECFSVDDNDDEEVCVLTVDATTRDSWATKPIWQLPEIVVGEFQGQRSSAKAFAKELAQLWEIPEVETETGGGPSNRARAGAKKGGKTKMKGLSQHRRRKGGHRQSWY